MSKASKTGNIKKIYNVWVFGVLEEKEREDGTKKLFEKIVSENFPNLSP